MAAIVLTVVKATQDIISKGLVIHKQLMQAKKNKKGCVRLAYMCVCTNVCVCMHISMSVCVCMYVCV